MELAAPWALASAAAAIAVLGAALIGGGGAIPVATVAGLRRVRPTHRQLLRRAIPLIRALTVILLAVAIARPRIGEAEATVPAEGIDIALSLDISSSMETNRVGSKNRLETAKDVIRDFIKGRENDRIGLVVFQEDALALAPPSLDYRALDEIVADLESGLLPDGTGVGVGIAEALNLLRESPASSRVVILLTDGEHNAPSISPEDAADLASALRIRVYTIGIKIEDKQAVRGEFDEERLRNIAERTGALYFAATSKEDLAGIYEEIGRLETSRVGREQFRKYTELGPWFALGAVGLLALEILLRTTVARRTPR